VLSLSNRAISHNGAVLSHISASQKDPDYKNKGGSSFIAGWTSTLFERDF